MWPLLQACVGFFFFIPYFFQGYKGSLTNWLQSKFHVNTKNIKLFWTRTHAHTKASPTVQEYFPSSHSILSWSNRDNHVCMHTQTHTHTLAHERETNMNRCLPYSIWKQYKINWKPKWTLSHYFTVSHQIPPWLTTLSHSHSPIHSIISHFSQIRWLQHLKANAYNPRFSSKRWDVMGPKQDINTIFSNS